MLCFGSQKHYREEVSQGGAEVSSLGVKVGDRVSQGEAACSSWESQRKRQP